MQGPLQISFKDIARSDALAAEIQRRAGKLDQFFNSVMGCRVTVEAPHQRHTQGNLYRIRIVINVPGDVITVGEGAKPNLGSHQDAYVAVRDAFDAAERRLKHYASRLKSRSQKRGPDARGREGPVQGRILRIVRESADGMDAYGFIQTQDGREIYFHRNSVLNGEFDRLSAGDEVRFSEEPGENGAQATSVDRVGREGFHVFSQPVLRGH